MSDEKDMEDTPDTIVLSSDAVDGVDALDEGKEVDVVLKLKVVSSGEDGAEFEVVSGKVKDIVSEMNKAKTYEELDAIAQEDK